MSAADVTTKQAYIWADGRPIIRHASVTGRHQDVMIAIGISRSPG
jgi:hypothetical protein